MNRAIHKIITWYCPNEDDMKLCADCAHGWAFYCSDVSGLYFHKPNGQTDQTICRAVNNITRIKPFPHKMLSKAA